MLSGIVQGTGDAVALVLLFGFTIFLHELGHFLLARRLGLVVETFSIGFGPALWKRKIRGVTYKIGLIPVGGYVALPQLDPSGMAVIQGPSEEGGAVSRRREKQSWWAVFFGRQVHDKVASEGRESTLPPVAPWKKIVVSISGAAGNCLLALGMAWGIYLAPEAASTGVPDEGAIVGHVDTNSVAYSRGIRMGDKILAVNGRQVRSWYEFNVESLLGSGRSNVVNLTLLSLDGAEKRVSVPTVPNERGMYAVEGVHKAIPCILGRVTKGGSAEAAGARPGDRVVEFDGVRVTGWEHFRSLVEKTGEREVVMVVERKGKRISLTVTPRYDEKFGRPMIGVELGEILTMPWMQQRRPLAQLKSDAMAIVRILQALVTPREAKRAADGLGGPVMIIAALWASIQISLLNALGFLRFLNVNLAIINLLPIPVLDGGHILFALWEVVTRRRASPRVVGIIVNVFATLLIGAFVLLTWRDISRLLDWHRVFRGSPEKVEKTVPAGGSGVDSPTRSDPAGPDQTVGPR